MPIYEYKVVPAPEKGQKAKGVKGVRERFALALESLMNELGAEGWEYIRADMLPCEERSGLTGSATAYHNMLVFRRTLGERFAATAPQPAQWAPATVTTPAPATAAGAAVPPVATPRAAPTEDSDDEDTPEAARKQTSTTEEAAAAAAAALTAFRDRFRATTPNAPKVGPARQD